MNTNAAVARIIEITTEISRLEAERTRLHDSLNRGSTSLPTPVQAQEPQRVEPSEDLPRCDTECAPLATRAQTRGGTNTELLEETKDFFLANPGRKYCAMTVGRLLRRGNSDLTARLRQLHDVQFLKRGRALAPNSNRAVDCYWLNLEGLTAAKVTPAKAAPSKPINMRSVPAKPPSSMNPGLPMGTVKKGKKNSRLSASTYAIVKEKILEVLTAAGKELTSEEIDTKPFKNSTRYETLRQMERDDLIKSTFIIGPSTHRNKVYGLRLQ